MKIIVVIASIVIFIYGMLASMLGTIVPALALRLSLSNLEMSYLALAQGIGLALTSVWAGALMDRSGRKLGVLVGLCASVFGLGILSAASSLSLGIVAMLFLGAGGSLVIVGANALVNDVSFENKAPALNLLNLFVGLGGMATPLVAGNLLHSDPTRVAYCGIAIALLALGLTLFAPIAQPTVRDDDARGAGLFGEFPLYILSAITFLYTACEFALWNWLPKFLIAAGIPAVTALNILSLGFACGLLIGRFVAAKLLGAISPFVVTLTCTLITCATTFVLLHVATVDAFAALVFITGLAMAPIFPTTIAMVGRIFQQRTATAIGFAITCGFSGLVVSSPLIGMLAGPSPQGIGHALRLIPFATALMVAILLLSRRVLHARMRSPASARPLPFSPIEDI